jgi:F0F1-type ATP synthase assembly protein I
MFIAAGVQSYFSCSGLLIGWWVAQPPNSEKVEVSNITPLISWGMFGTLIGLLAAVLIISRKLSRTRDGNHGIDN